MARDHRGFTLEASSYSSPYILLGNGQKIFDVVDLAPYVARETEIGQLIETVRRGRAKVRRVDRNTIIAIGVGAALIAAGAYALKGDNAIGIAPVAVGAVAVFGGMGDWVFSKRPRGEPAIDDRLLASYNASVMRTLDLCVSDMQVVSCGAGPPGGR